MDVADLYAGQGSEFSWFLLHCSVGVSKTTKSVTNTIYFLENHS